MLWIWRWTVGGYNSCTANTREEALAKAREMSSMLHVKLDSLHAGTYIELDKLDREFAAMFD